jgi:hypothetical protein
MKINIKEFNNDGLVEWKSRYDLAVTEKRNTFDLEFLQDAKYTSDLGLEIEIENKPFTTREGFIKFITEALDLKKNRYLHQKKAFWTWLASLYFETITKKKKDGSFEVRAIQWYYAGDPGGTGRKNRHAIQFACRIYVNSPSYAIVALTGKPYNASDLYDRLGDQRQFMLNRTLIAVIYEIYHGTDEIVRKNIRRFFKVLKQISMTRDVESMSGTEIMALLPEDIKGHLKK